MRSRATSLLLGILACLMLASGLAQENQPTEYQVKAAFLFNFIKFVVWPENALPEKNSPITIGIFGDTPFQKEIQKTIEGKKIEEHRLSVKKIVSTAETEGCQVIFFAASENANTPDVLKALKGKSVLLVGESDGFIENGGIINFVREGTKIRFQISKPAAESAHLQISAKLLMLAVPGTH